MSAPGTHAAARTFRAGTWRFDPAASTLRFSVRKLGLHRVRGTLALVDGVVVVDRRGAVVSVNGAVDPNAVDTGNARRDADLRGPRLFGVDEVPRWTFESADVVSTGDGWRITGMLTARSTCAVVWDARITDGEDGSVHVTATTRVDRRDAGITAPRALVGHEIDVTLGAVLTEG